MKQFGWVLLIWLLSLFTIRCTDSSARVDLQLSPKTCTLDGVCIESHALTVPQGSFKVVYARSDNDVWVGERFDVLWHFDGKQWMRTIPPHSGSIEWTGIYSVNENEAWAIGYATLDDVGKLYHWNGVAWFPYQGPCPDKPDQWCSASELEQHFYTPTVLSGEGRNVWIGGLKSGAGKGIVYRLREGQLEVALDGTDFAISALWASPNGSVWVVGSDSLLMGSPTGEWKSRKFDSGDQLISMTGNAAGDLWISTITQGNVWYHNHQTDFTQWSKFTQFAGTWINSMTVDQSGALWVSQAAGGAGLTNVKQCSPFTVDLNQCTAAFTKIGVYALFGSPSIHGIWAVGDFGVVHYLDGELIDPTHQRHEPFVPRPTLRAGTSDWIVGDSNSVWHRDSATNRWDRVDLQLEAPYDIYDVAVDSNDADKVWMVGFNGFLFRYAANNKMGIRIELPDFKDHALRAVLASSALNPSLVWVGGDEMITQVRIRDDGKIMDSTIIPGAVKGVQISSIASKVSDLTGPIWAVGKDQNGKGFAIRYFLDHGAWTWQTIESPGPPLRKVVWKANDMIFAVDDQGGLWFANNAKAAPTWSLVTPLSQERQIVALETDNANNWWIFSDRGSLGEQTDPMILTPRVQATSPFPWTGANFPLSANFDPTKFSLSLFGEQSSISLLTYENLNENLKFSLKDIRNLPPIERYRATIKKDNAETLWAVHEGSVSRFSQGQWQTYPGFDRGYYKGLAFAEDGQPWAIWVNEQGSSFTKAIRDPNDSMPRISASHIRLNKMERWGDTLWAVGDTGKIVSYHLGTGETQTVQCPTTLNLVDMVFVNSGFPAPAPTILVLNEKGGAMISRGRDCEDYFSTTPVEGWGEVIWLSGADVWGLKGNSVLKNGIIVWISVSKLNAIWGRGGDDLWVAGDQGSLFHFNGNSWTTLETGTAENLVSLWGDSQGALWILGEGGLLLRGNHFSQNPIPKDVL